MNIDRSRRALAVILALTCLAAADALSERRQRVEQMSPSQKQTLADNQQRLLQLEPDEQARLRALAAELEQDSDAARLRAIMIRYEAWMERLPIDTRSQLMQLTDDERIARIKLLVSNELPLAGQQLAAQDAKLVAAWIERRMLENMPREQRERLEQAPAAERRRMIARLVWQRSQQAGTQFGFNFRAQDLQAMGETLSPAARRQMMQAVTTHRGQQLAIEWIRQSLGIYPGPSRSGGLLLPRGGNPAQRGPGGEFRPPLPPPGESSNRPAAPRAAAEK